MTTCTHSPLGTPRGPSDDTERDAIMNVGKCCGASGPCGFACTRAPHLRGDHVATGPVYVYERWPFDELHGEDRALRTLLDGGHS